MRIAMVSAHTSPLAPLGGRETGGMNVYVLELSRELARLGYEVDIFTRRDGDCHASRTSRRTCASSASTPAPRS